MKKSDYIKSQLTGAKGVVSVTGRGLMLGIACERPAKDVIADCMAGGVLVLSASDNAAAAAAFHHVRRAFRGRRSLKGGACQMKHLLKLMDLTPEEISDILNTADQLKYEKKNGVVHHLLADKTLGMIFQKVLHAHKGLV